MYLTAGHQHKVPARQLPHTLEEGLPAQMARHDPLSHIARHRSPIRLKRHHTRRDQRLYLRAEGESIPRRSEIQWLHPEAVPREEKPPLSHVPDSQSPHTVEARQALRPPLLIGREQDLRIGARPEAIPSSLKLSTQLQVVVHLPI